MKAGKCIKKVSLLMRGPAGDTALRSSGTMVRSLLPCSGSPQAMLPMVREQWTIMCSDQRSGASNRRRMVRLFSIAGQP